MTREEFDRLVREVEQGVGRDQSRLRRRALILAVTGYVCLVAPFLCVLTIALAFIIPVLVWGLETAWLSGLIGLFVLALGAWPTLRVLWVAVETPPGRTVTRAEAPALHDVLDQLRQELRAVHFHEVKIVPGCNAAVTQVPRLGVLGWPRQYLLLGLDLMESLSVDEFRAVLAHEYAHLSKQHGRLGHWIYRLRRSWEKVFDTLNAQPVHADQVSTRPLLLMFIRWFWPRFNACAFVLSRAQEYEADEVGARLAGPTHMASSLLRIAFCRRYLEDKFWVDFWRRANETPTIPTGVFLMAQAGLKESWRHPEAAVWVDQEFKLPTTNLDTHPSLTDRLRALGRLPAQLVPANIPPLLRPPETSAAAALIGPIIARTRDELEAKWRKDGEEVWRNRHTRSKVLEDRIAQLEKAPAGADLDSLWDKARVMIDLQGDKAAEPLLRQILQVNPEHVEANFHLGRLLIEASDASGVAHLERVMDPDHEWFPHAAGFLRMHYLRIGNADAARQIDARLDEREQNLAKSHVERTSVSATDPLIAHGLTSAEIEKLHGLLRGDSDLEEAHLVRKELKFFPKQRFFLLCVRSYAPTLWSGDRDRALVRRLTHLVKLPGRFLVFPPSGQHGRLAARIRKMPGSRIYP